MGLKNLLLDSKQNLINMDLGSKNFIIKLVDRIDALFEFRGTSYGSEPNSNINGFIS